MTAHANIMLSFDGEFYHCFCGARGEDAEHVKKLIMLINSLPSDRETFVRTEPHFESYKEFWVDELTHHGVVRFSFSDRAGPRHPPESPK